MARLVCFYCNKRSNIHYDASIRRWDCAKCDATNFLDENGDITDPVVATETAPANLIHSTIRPDSPDPGVESEPPLFCATCLKNQHLYTSSIAQYDFDTNTRRADYIQDERAFFRWKRGLERRYPQVCEACEPKVLERMRRAGKTAKTDHLRRLMDKSRARRSAPPQGFNISRTIIFGGQLLWYCGILGQLIWNITAMTCAANHDEIAEFLTTTPGPIPVGIKLLLGLINSNIWAWRSLQCTYASVWWCPRFKEAERGFMKHITGFRHWYKLQLFAVVIRSIFYYNMGTGKLADPLSRATLGAHAAMAVMATLLFVIAHRTIKVDMSPLWAETPENFRFVGPSSGSNSPRSNRPDNKVFDTSASGGSLEDILDEIGRPKQKPLAPLEKSQNPGFRQRSESPAYQIQQFQTPDFAGEMGHGFSETGRQAYRQPYSLQKDARSFARPPTPPEQVIAELTKNRPLLNQMTDQEGSHWLATGELPIHFQGRYDQNNRSEACVEEMEWLPTVPQKSMHRAFNTPRPAQREAQAFGMTPAGDQPSPFWFKVPPAPTTPAQRLRNPPNQPRLRVPSAEVRDNFFGARQEPIAKSSGHSVEFSQQRLFFHEKSSEGDALAGMLDSFSLADGEKNEIRKNGVTKIIASTFALVVGGLLVWTLFWNAYSRIALA